MPCESFAAPRPERPLDCGLSGTRARRSLLHVASPEIRRPDSLHSLSLRLGSSQILHETRLSSIHFSSFVPSDANIPRSISRASRRLEAYGFAIFPGVSRNLVSSSVTIDAFTAPTAPRLALPTDSRALPSLHQR